MPERIGNLAALRYSMLHEGSLAAKFCSILGLNSLYGSLVNCSCPSDNKFPNPSLFTAWTLRGAAALTSNDAAALDGTTTAEKCTIGPNFGDDMYFITPLATFSNSAPMTTKMWIKKTTAAGTITLVSPLGASNGRWVVDLAKLSADWELLTTGHSAVTQTNAWVASADGRNGMQFIRGTIATQFIFHAWCVFEKET